MALILKKDDIIDLLDWMSTRFTPIGYNWLDGEKKDKITSSEEVLNLYLEEQE